MKGILSLAAFLAIIAIAIMMPTNAASQEEIDKAILKQAGATPGTVPSPQQSREIMATSSVAPVVTEVGKISWSIDGLGVYPGTTGIIQVEKPFGATVKNAYMAAATMGSSGYHLQSGDIKIDGADVPATNEIPAYPPLRSYNYWADVTSLVKAKIDAAPPGRIDFTITETQTLNIDGELLVVIFDDPAQITDNTIILMFGSQRQTGDDFNIHLAKPIYLDDPNLAIDFSLGISFSNQDNDDQYSIVDVNGKRMTSWAGGDDDGTGPMANGELFTVGGLDDSTDNPADPNAKPIGNKRYDDELYTLLPFVKNGDTNIAVHTQNPSDDDNLLFAGLFVRPGIVVNVDIEPKRCPNIIDLGDCDENEYEVDDEAIPVAILGTDEFCVKSIDPSSIKLSREGIDATVSPILNKYIYKDVSNPLKSGLCGCNKLDGDCKLDLVIFFNVREVAKKLHLKKGDADIKLALTGNLREEYQRRPIWGEDCVTVLKTHDKQWERIERSEKIDP